MRQALLAVALFTVACKTTADVRQGGADFRAGPVSRPLVEAERLFDVCWPNTSGSTDAVELHFEGSQVDFTVSGGATNATGRCVREIATTYPWETPRSGPMTVRPPNKPVSGWAVLAYVRLLSPGRFGPERGLLDPAPVVAACLKTGTPLRPQVQFEVRHEPALKVQVFAASGAVGAFTSAERCVEAVLGATAWPNTRRHLFELDDTLGAPPPAAESLPYALPTGLAVPIDPQRTKEALSARQGGVAACWEQALTRRAGLSGARTVRAHVTPHGEVSSAIIVGNESDSAATAADYLLDRCLIDVVSTARFAPGPEGDAVYSWVFAERTQ